MKKSQKIARLPPLIGASKDALSEIESFSSIIDHKNKFRLTKLVNQFVKVFQTRDLKYYSDTLQGKEMEVPPIFILGHWRSGTTFLHNCLCQDENASFVSTYQSVFPHNLRSRFLFENFMKLAMPARRPADNVRLSTNLPQEEEFALSNMTYLAYYHFWYLPLNHQFFLKNLDWNNLLIHQKVELKSCLQTIYQKAWLDTGRGQLIIKNPVNLSRIPLLLELYPEAKFVHISRKSSEVYHSTKRFFSKILEPLCFQKYSEEELNEIILSTYPALYSHFDKHKILIPESNIVDISFSQLLHTPYESIQNIYSKLSLKMNSEFSNKLNTYCENQTKSHKVTAYEANSKLETLLKDRWDKYYIS